MRRMIPMSAFLKMFIIKVVSLPKYVKGAHLCGLFWFLAGGCGRLSRGGMCVCVCIRNPLFHMMSWIVSSSSLNSLCCRYHLICVCRDLYTTRTRMHIASP